MVTATQEWHHHVDETLKALAGQKANLLASMANEEIRLHILKRCAIPALTYGMGAMAYSPAKLRLLSSRVASLAKAGYGLQQGTQRTLAGSVARRNGLSSVHWPASQSPVTLFITNSLRKH